MNIFNFEVNVNNYNYKLHPVSNKMNKTDTQIHIQCGWRCEFNRLKCVIVIHGRCWFLYSGQR